MTNYHKTEPQIAPAQKILLESSAKVERTKTPILKKSFQIIGKEGKLHEIFYKVRVTLNSNKARK